MDEHDALLRIQELMDGVEWTPDTLERIAEILEMAGFQVRDSKNRGTTAALCPACGSEKPVGQSCGCFDNGCE